jgi:hypothetical protein
MSDIPVLEGDAQRAQLALRAAFPNRDYAAVDLEALGKKLNRAADWRAIAAMKRPAGERGLLRKIRGAAKKLADLLSENDETNARIEHDWPQEMEEGAERPGWSEWLQQRHLHFHDAVRAVRMIEEATMAALGPEDSRQRGPAVLEDVFGSPMKLMVRLMASAYADSTGERPSISRAADSTIGGPFVRFVQEAAKQFGTEAPSAETVRAALDDLRSSKK